MFCPECNEEMAPLKGSICVSGEDTYCAPCWGCESCGNVSYVQYDNDFDVWVEAYIKDGSVDPKNNFGFWKDTNVNSL